MCNCFLNAQTRKINTHKKCETTPPPPCFLWRYSRKKSPPTTDLNTSPQRNNPMKRGEIAITTIILIALGLIVLTLLASLLVGSFQRGSDTIDACQETYGGNCERSTTQCIGQGGRVVGGTNCEANQVTSANNRDFISFGSGGEVCCVS